MLLICHLHSLIGLINCSSTDISFHSHFNIVFQSNLTHTHTKIQKLIRIVIKNTGLWKTVHYWKQSKTKKNFLYLLLPLSKACFSMAAPFSLLSFQVLFGCFSGWNFQLCFSAFHPSHLPAALALTSSFPDIDYVNNSHLRASWCLLPHFSHILKAGIYACVEK